jgi:NAD(P)-dependent dehydrogenase (short-subunit alcohol dehydrogenase family)
LINNVGVFNAEPALDIDDDGWRRMFDVNVLSGIRLTRHYAPGMAERRHGRVIFISSEAGVHPPTNMVHYGVSKTAQLAAARGFAQALACTGVTVNSVLAGPTMSDGVLAMWDDIYPGEPASKTHPWRRSPRKRVASNCAAVAARRTHQDRRGEEGNRGR